MEVSKTEFKRSDLLKVTGRVDSNTAPELEKAIQESMDAGKYRIVVDMSELSFISSAGIRVLVSAAKTARRFNRGDLYLADLPPNIMDTFKLAGLTRVFKIYPNTVEAVGNF